MFHLWLKITLVLGLFLLDLVKGEERNSGRDGRQLAEKGQCHWDLTTNLNPHVYFINQDVNKVRREYTEMKLNSFGFKGHRIEAVTPVSSSYNVSILHKPCKRNTPKDIAVILSHLTAMHRAIYDINDGNSSGSNGNSDSKRGSLQPEGRGSERDDSSIPLGGSKKYSGSQPPRMSDYALIIEDDVKFIFHLNFTALILSAPNDFGVLQLTTSNLEAIDRLWAEYERKLSFSKASYDKLNNLEEKQRFLEKFEGNQSHTELWTESLWGTVSKTGREALFWSTQAYLINKKVIKPFIDDVVTSEANGDLSFKIINSFNQNKCHRTKRYPCILANCLFADTYLYAGAGPTYVTHVPLFTGAAMALSSELHQEHVAVHKKGFDRIDAITTEIQNGFSLNEVFEANGLSSVSLAEKSNIWVPSYIIGPRTCQPDSSL